MGYNNIRECELAFSRNEVKEYLEGIGVYTEPPDKYSDHPPTDVHTRNNCINMLYARDKDINYILKYKESLLELSKGRVDQLQIALKYIMAQLQLENKNSASFKLDDKNFYEELKRIIQSKENEIKNTHEQELADMWNILEVQNKYIESKTGYNIR